MIFLHLDNKARFAGLWDIKYVKDSMSQMIQLVEGSKHNYATALIFTYTQISYHQHICSSKKKGIREILGL